MPQVNYQDYVVRTVRAAAILTNAYVAGTILGAKTATLNNSAPTDLCLEGYNQVNLLITFVPGSLTSLEVKVEYSVDNSVWYQDTFVSYADGTCTASLGEYTFSDAGNYTVSLPIKARYIKISAKGTGTVTNSSCTISAIVGTV